MRNNESEALGRGQLLAICALHRPLSLLNRLVLNEAKAFRLAVLGCSDLARQNVSELGKSVQEITRGDGRIDVLDEDVSGTRLAHGGVALLPHDAKGPSLDNVVVQGFEGTLGVLSAGKVDVSVAKGHTGNMVTKHTDGVDGADDGEDFEEMLFANILVEIADVQGGGGRGGGGTSDGSNRSSNVSSHFFFDRHARKRETFF